MCQGPQPSQKHALDGGTRSNLDEPSQEKPSRFMWQDWPCFHISGIIAGSPAPPENAGLGRNEACLPNII